MDGATFDRLARNVARRVSRRWLLAATGGFAVVKSQRVSASQLTPSTCGASGEVCTMLLGCCDGLTCVTSAINTNYGVCVAGEGGTVSIGTSLISPFSENVEQEVAAMAAGTTDTTSSTTTTDVVAEREQRIADKKLRKENRRDDKKLRKNTQQDEQQDRREDQRLARDLRRGPKLVITLLNPGGGGSSIETLRVTNRDDTNVVLTKIESLLNPTENTDLNRSVRVGATFSLYSGPVGEISDDDEHAWRNTPICTTHGEAGSGFRVYAGASATSEVTEYKVLCQGPENGDGVEKPRKKKRKRQANRGRKGGNSRNKNG